jgi:uracil-DNA glycosylase
MSATKIDNQINTIIKRLNQKHPDARYELNWETPLELLVATILAAQCTDERVNQVTPKLFEKYSDARAYAEADLDKLAKDLKAITFYNNKAKTIKATCQVLVERFGGEVPRTIEEMVTLPGVARKTANVVLNNAFRIPSGIVVDTHVARVSQRLGLSGQSKPERIELDLMRQVPKDEWVQFGAAMVLHGRYTCTFEAPHCTDCIFNDLCPRIGVEGSAATLPAQQQPSPAPNGSKKPQKTAGKKPAMQEVPRLKDQLPADWQQALTAEFEKPYFRDLEKFVAAERQARTVFPPAEDMFNAFRHTPYDQVKVVLLGQDPYHDDGQAHGLCFSVRPGVKPPPSLVNIFKELNADLGCLVPDHGTLTPWAQRGVLLLNTVLTVRAHEANSHKDKGWEQFTDAVIRAVSARAKPLVFLLWGSSAQKKQELIDTQRHRVLTAGHPSPLSSKKFFGSRPFSGANKALEAMGQAPIDWGLPNLANLADEAPQGISETTSATAESVPPKPAGKPSKMAQFLAPSPPVPVQPAAKPEPPPTRLAGFLPEDWRAILASELTKPSFRKLDEFLAEERVLAPVLPGNEDVFQAFHLASYYRTRVVFLGDAPPASEAQADGLLFSVKPGSELTPTLVNLFTELRNDLGCWMPVSGSLSPWARQGVLLLNTVLTARTGEPDAHRGHGWEAFTDGVIAALNARRAPVVFALFGTPIHAKAKRIDMTRHAVLTFPDPQSPDFLGSRCFSAINTALQLRGEPSVYWQLYYST